MTEENAGCKAEGARISTEGLLEVRAGLRAYYTALEATDLSESPKPPTWIWLTTLCDGSLATSNLALETLRTR